MVGESLLTLLEGGFILETLMLVHFWQFHFYSWKMWIWKNMCFKIASNQSYSANKDKLDLFTNKNKTSHASSTASLPTTGARMHACTHACMRANMHARMHARAHAHACAPTCTRKQTCMLAFVPTFTYARQRTRKLILHT